MIVVGLTSGPCVDAIEVAVCEIVGEPTTLRADVLSALSIPWPIELRKLVLEMTRPDQVNMADFSLLDTAVGEAYAAAALEGIASVGYYPEQVDLIGMQSQTVRHEVREDGHVLAPVELGQAAIVTEWTGITTISKFRERDIAAGGQGAPLNAYVDWLLLRHPTRSRIVLNLDNIASMALVPPRSLADAAPLACDVGPGMVYVDYVLDNIVAAAAGDDSAPPGQVDEPLLTDLLSHPFLKRQPPKTAGYLLFGQADAADHSQQALNRGISPANLLPTFIAFAVTCMVDAVKAYAPDALDEVILRGRGRKYAPLAEQLRQALAPVEVLDQDAVCPDSANRRALDAAVLAYETWHHRPGTLPTLTGVQSPTPLGCILPGLNYRTLIKQTW